VPIHPTAWDASVGIGPGRRRKIAGLCRRAKRKRLRKGAGIATGELISTAFVASAVNEIVAKRMNKKQQIWWNRTTV
jgi:hypothetical protein